MTALGMEVTAHYGLLLSGRTLKGSLYGGWKPKTDIPMLIDMYLKKVTSPSIIEESLRRLQSINTLLFAGNTNR